MDKTHVVYHVNHFSPLAEQLGTKYGMIKGKPGYSIGNIFRNGPKMVAEVSKMPISQDEKYAVLAEFGLHKGPSNVEKVGNVIMAGVGAVAGASAAKAIFDKKKSKSTASVTQPVPKVATKPAPKETPSTLTKIKDAIITGNKSGAVDVLKSTKAGAAIAKISDALPQSVKQNIVAEGEKMLSKFRRDQTAPETLPKTRPQKQLEAAVQPGGAISMPQLSLNNPLVISGLVLLVIAVIVSITRK